MINQKSDLFRKEALERASSPEELDQIMQVVSPKKWLPLVAGGSLVATGLTWSFLGRIPITVTGTGIIVYPSTITSFQSPIAGKLRTINVRAGDYVNRGDVLATLDQGELMKQLQLVRSKLGQLPTEDSAASLVQGQRQNADKEAIKQQRQSLQQNLQAVQKLTPILREKGLNSIQRDRANQTQSLQALRDLLPTFKQRLTNRQQLLQEGAISGDTVLQSQQDYLNAVTQINEAESQLKQLDVKEADAQRQYLENLNSIKDLQAQLKQLDSKEATAAQQDLETVTTRKKRNSGSPAEYCSISTATIEQQLSQEQLLWTNFRNLGKSGTGCFTGYTNRSDRCTKAIGSTCECGIFSRWRWQANSTRDEVTSHT